MRAALVAFGSAGLSESRVPLVLLEGIAARQLNVFCDASDCEETYAGFPGGCVKQKRVLSVGKPDSLAERSYALRAVGFSVFSTDSPEQAMTVCLQSEFDLALVGHQLSNRDKQRLVRHFREKCGIPILLVTDGPFLTTLRADAYVSVQSSISALVKAAQEIACKKPVPPAAAD